MSTVAALAAGVITGLLVYRDPRMPSAKGERGVVAFAWVVNAGLAVVVAVAFGEEWLEWGVATAFTAVTIGTGGRPALVMDEVI